MAPFPPNNLFIFMLSFRLTTKTYFSIQLCAGGCGRGGLVVGAANGVCVLSCESHTILYTESGERDRESDDPRDAMPSRFKILFHEF